MYFLIDTHEDNYIEEFENLSDLSEFINIEQKKEEGRFRVIRGDELRIKTIVMVDESFLGKLSVKICKTEGE